jgi:hypothetical protein
VLQFKQFPQQMTFFLAHNLANLMPRQVEVSERIKPNGGYML